MSWRIDIRFDVREAVLAIQQEEVYKSLLGCTTHKHIQEEHCRKSALAQTSPDFLLSHTTVLLAVTIAEVLVAMAAS